MKEFGITSTLIERSPLGKLRVAFVLGTTPIGISTLSSEPDDTTDEGVHVSVLVDSPDNPPLLSLQLRGLRRACELLEAHASAVEETIEA